MRHVFLLSLVLATALAVPLAAPVAAQGIAFPTTDFPQPGTFCGPLRLCQPLTTRDTGR